MHHGAVTIEGGTIAFSDSGGAGLAALLVHGNSSSRNAWAGQLDSELGRRHRLVAIDLPGHGDSFRLPPDADTLGALVRGVAQAASALDLDASVLVGHSLGGHLLLQARSLGLLPRARALLVQGTPPLSGPADFAAACLPNPAAGFVFTADLTDDQMQMLVGACYGPDAAPESALRAFRETDPSIRTGLGAALMAGGLRDEHKVVRELDVPIALVHGERDSLVNGAWLEALDAPTLWRSRVHVIAGAGHFAQWSRPEAFNETLSALLGDVMAT